MDNNYSIIAFPAPGLMLTSHPRFGKQMWTEARMTHKHKKDKCPICGMEVGRRAYRPLTNRGNRPDRICANHLARQAGEGSENDD